MSLRAHGGKMADTRVYRHDVSENSGSNAVAIVAIVLVVLVAIALTVVYWDRIVPQSAFADRTVINEGDTIIDNPDTNPIETNTIRETKETNTNTVIMPDTTDSSTSTNTDTGATQ